MQMPTLPLLRQTGDLDNYDCTHARLECDYNGPIEDALKQLRQSTTKRLQILIVGPGNGKYDALLVGAKTIEDDVVDLVDPSQTALAAISKTLEGTKGSFYTHAKTLDDWLVSRNCQQEDYDLILAFSVLHHLPNWRDSLAQLVNKLTPSGLLLVDEWCEGNPLYPLDMNGDLGTKPEIRAAFLRREAETGVFWDPELRGHRMRPLISWMERLGFQHAATEPDKPTVSPQSITKTIDVSEALKTGADFAITRWGHGTTLAAYHQAAPPISCQSQGNEARVQILKFLRNAGNRVFTATGDEEWAAARIHQHFATTLSPSDNPSVHAEKRILQALQLMIHYGVVCADTLWCIPIRAKISEETLEPIDEAEPPTHFLLQDCEEGYKALPFSLLNMRRLLTEVNLRSGAITTEILRMLGSVGSEPRHKTSVFHVRNSDAGSPLRPENDTLFPRYSITVEGGPEFDTNSRTSAEEEVQELQKKGGTHRFGEFVVHNLAEAYNRVWPSAGTPPKDPHSPSDVSALLREFGPMLRPGDVLHLVLSTYRTDLLGGKIEDHLIGGFLLLERDRSTKGELAKIVDDIRFTRMQLIARLLQAEVLDYLHIRKQEQLAESRGWRKAAQLQARIKHDLDRMLQKTVELSTTAQRISREMETSRIGFLGLCETLHIVFDPKEPPFEFSCNADREFMRDSKPGLKPESDNVFCPFHSTSSCRPYRSFDDAWTALIRLFRALTGESGFREKWLNNLADIDRRHAESGFNFLKILLYKSVSDPHLVFDVQVLFALGNTLARWKQKPCVEVFDHLVQAHPVPVVLHENERFLDLARFVNTFQSLSFSHNNGGGLFDPSASSLCLAESTRSGDVIGSLIRMCEELSPDSKRGGEGILIDKALVHPMAKGCLVTIECNGCLPESAFLLDDLSGSHGLRSCFELLCRAANQRQPEQLHTPILTGAFRKGLFFVNVGKRMTLYYGLEREDQPKTNSQGSAALEEMSVRLPSPAFVPTVD